MPRKQAKAKAARPKKGEVVDPHADDEVSSSSSTNSSKTKSSGPENECNNDPSKDHTPPNTPTFHYSEEMSTPKGTPRRKGNAKTPPSAGSGKFAHRLALKRQQGSPKKAKASGSGKGNDRPAVDVESRPQI